MQFQFEELAYQTNAVSAVVDLFDGQPETRYEFALSSGFNGNIVANHLALPLDEIGKNLKEIQARNSITEQSSIGEHGKNFTIEMETGTGKTFVYLKTIFELNNKYGWKKFVIVVPSVAIREGVLQTLNATKAYFSALYDNAIMQYSVYDSKKLNTLKNFAISTEIQILIINIQAFNSADNVINTVNESGVKPIDYIAQTCPIVILDEPQNMETDTAKQAIGSLNGLFHIRYSATHKNLYHQVYALNAVDAYREKLVKQIEVASVLSENEINGAYLKLLKIKPQKRSITADIALIKNGKIQTVSVTSGDDLFHKSNGNSSYQNGFIINYIDADNNKIELSNGESLSGSLNTLQDEIMKKQMEETIQEHLAKEKKLNALGIKVLSLFFIDKVANYRQDGKFYQWFEEIYKKYQPEISDDELAQIHGGYFSQDKSGSLKDTKGNTQADNDTYQLIMKDKERLLSLNNPLRFIFSHSALKEGWDNPNVFQICTLNETNSVIKKRQEIGRGLRLPVNQNGERIRNDEINILTIIPNESYLDFAMNLQTEYEEDGIAFSYKNIGDKRKKAVCKYRKNFALSPEFNAIWQELNHQVSYRVKFDSQKLIDRSAEELQDLDIPATKITVSRAKLEQTITYGVEATIKSVRSEVIDNIDILPDLISEIQKKTDLTRQSIFAILQKSGKINEAFKNPQIFIDTVSQKINRVLADLMLDGIEYRKLNQNYQMSLFKDFEFFKNDFTFAVQNQEKTIYENFIPLDSKVENQFAQNCESLENVLFYFKLPKWFKIPTPIGNYNPDWAVVRNRQTHAYFIAETKGSTDKTQLRASEAMKIEYAKKCFENTSMLYAAVKNTQEMLEK